MLSSYKRLGEKRLVERGEKGFVGIRECSLIRGERVVLDATQRERLSKSDGLGTSLRPVRDEGNLDTKTPSHPQEKDQELCRP